MEQSINQKEIVFKASRYDKGKSPSNYLNCPMDKNDYIHFRNALIEGEQANLKDFEKESANFFEACFTHLKKLLEEELIQ